jgi:hypothetical protein
MQKHVSTSDLVAAAGAWANNEQRGADGGAQAQNGAQAQQQAQPTVPFPRITLPT